MKSLFTFVVALSTLTYAVEGVAQPIAQTLQIDTTSGRHAFSIELVRSRADMERGLMFRKSMPADHGMLFDFQKAQPIAMWMKNTYLALDMVFVSPEGRVTHVAENAVPMSEEIISSDGPAMAILELNAGVASKIGVKPGDVVHASIFPR